jgi:hypothetical protein
MKRAMMVFAFLCFLPALAAAQTAPGSVRAAAADTVKTQTPVKPAAVSRPAKPDSAAEEEMELEAIAIEAIIEKPNVDIIPKRVVPELEEVEFVERSFDRELKEVPKDLLLLDDDLDRVVRLEGLRKLVEKKKK